MQIELNGREYTLNFGLAFIREMDKRYTIEQEGFPFAFGIQSAVIYLQQGKASIIADIIQAATITERQKPSVQAIEEWIGEQEDLQAVADDFLKSLSTAPMTRAEVKNLLDAQ